MLIAKKNRIKCKLSLTQISELSFGSVGEIFSKPGWVVLNDYFGLPGLCRDVVHDAPVHFFGYQAEHTELQHWNTQQFISNYQKYLFFIAQNQSKLSNNCLKKKKKVRWSFSMWRTSWLQSCVPHTYGTVYPVPCTTVLVGAGESSFVCCDTGCGFWCFVLDKWFSWRSWSLSPLWPKQLSERRSKTRTF